MKLLSDCYIENYIASQGVDIVIAWNQIRERSWTSENFRFYTAVSVMSSSRIEGETMEIDSYLKYKLQQIEYVPNLVEKPNDLFEAYEYASDYSLCASHFLESHRIATQHVLVESQRGVLRTGNMLLLDQQTQQVQYEAAPGAIVKIEFERLFSEMEELIRLKLKEPEVFYFAALIHLVLVKIHPFNDGNGRTARLLEKWFLATKPGEKAWAIGSEFYYNHHLQAYYSSLAGVGFFYHDLNYEISLPLLRMLPDALTMTNNY